MGSIAQKHKNVSLKNSNFKNESFVFIVIVLEVISDKVASEISKRLEKRWTKIVKEEVICSLGRKKNLMV